MKSADIREKFLRYFESKGHTIVRASSLLTPSDDPTLLFVNSGMVQFKDVFTGREKRPYTRATTAQKSLRAGGKHNDLENVGYTARHHTFFEMLGNFSFGDYFKRDAIHFAWQLLTEVYKLPKEKLWATVYVDDDEAYDIWTKEIGVPPERCVRIGDKPGQPKYVSDNFWQMADTGPCGPCSEIFYDHGPEVVGGPPGSPDAEGDRYIEVWNLVFMQFDRDAAGTLTPLPRPCVDTGMGLERLAAVLQHVHSNYDIDLFQNLISAAARETNVADRANNSLKVIADHIRACSFLIADGVIPGNEGRGYVLRRIIRRALRHGYKLGQTRPFFYRIVKDVAAEMGAAYPELVEQQARIELVLKQEEERFGETLENGMKILDAALGQMKSGDAPMLDGETVFLLYDTYGFPVDLTGDICRERGVAIDHAGFGDAMERQRGQARAAARFKLASGFEYAGDKTRFTGYSSLVEDAKVIALYQEGAPVQRLQAGAEGIVVLNTTPFYSESGGQVGDRGVLESISDRHVVRFAVADTQKIQADVFGHHGTLESGTLNVGDTVQAKVDALARERTRNNHSATHLMHTALRGVLGKHVQQRGSLVDSERTRFDFSHDKAMTPDEIRKVEDIVNTAIRSNAQVSANVMKYDDAIKGGALAFFGDKYGDEVRVLQMGDHSTELCGGTHVARTGDIGFFKIVSEGGVAAGVRRIEAVTGRGAVEFVQAIDRDLQHAAFLLKAPTSEVTQKITQIQENVKSLERELVRLKSRLAASKGDDLASQAVDINGVKVLAASLEGADAKSLRETMDQLKSKLKSAVIVLGAIEGDRVQLAAGVTADTTAKVKAGDLVNFVAQQVGGKGGGRADMAMAGGSDPSKLPSALASVQSWAQQRL
ncbi:MAG: alanine--tRNA ligase [Burkholderiaceae bacterium]|nr:alanine--tRNA ligase [Burkholderiaceae bacterium]